VPVAVPYANLTNPQTLNLYAMVADDPESFADLDRPCVGGNGGPCEPVSPDVIDQKDKLNANQANTAALQRDQNQKAQGGGTLNAAAVGAAAGAVTGAVVGAVVGAAAGAAAGVVTAAPTGEAGAVVTVPVLSGAGAAAGAQAGAEIGAAAGAAVGALAPVVYTKTKDAAAKATEHVKTALAHLSGDKLGGPAKDPRGGWRNTVQRSADAIEKQANRISNKTVANGLRLLSDFIRGAIPPE
jgi:hypothetical protein